MSSERDWTVRNKNTVISCKEKYGKDVINPAQTLKSKENSKKTLIERYGSVENSYKQRVEKSKLTYLEHFGVDHNFKSKEWQENTKKIILEKYDVDGLYNGTLLDLGYPRIDFSLETSESELKIIKNKLGIKNSKQIVFYATT